MFVRFLRIRFRKGNCLLNQLIIMNKSNVICEGTLILKYALLLRYQLQFPLLDLYSYSLRIFESQWEKSKRKEAVIACVQRIYIYPTPALTLIANLYSSYFASFYHSEHILKAFCSKVSALEGGQIATYCSVCFYPWIFINYIRHRQHAEIVLFLHHPSVPSLKLRPAFQEEENTITVTNLPSPIR